MKTSKHVLIISPPEASLIRVARTLKALEFRVSHASTPAIARQAIDRGHDLALVAVDGSAFPEEGPDLVRAAKREHPRLPVLWIGDSAPDDARPDAVLPASVDESTLEARTKALLIDDLYPQSFVRAFVSACNEILTTTFECAVESGEPLLSNAASRAGNVTGFLQFVGEGVLGHLTVSGEEEGLAALAERIGFDPADGQRRLAIDITGELANQMAGRMKATIESLVTIRLGLPYAFTGRDVGIHTPSPKPSLSMRLDAGVAKLDVEFWYQSRSGPNAEAERVAVQLAEEGLLFL